MGAWKRKWLNDSTNDGIMNRLVKVAKVYGGWKRMLGDG